MSLTQSSFNFDFDDSSQKSEIPAKEKVAAKPLEVKAEKSSEEE